MKVHFFKSKKLIQIIRFLAIFRLTFATNNNHEGATMGVFTKFVKETLKNASNSSMGAEH